MQNSSLNYLYFCLIAFFWGSSFAAIATVVSIVPPFFAAMLRIGFALLFLILIRCLFKHKVSFSIPLSQRWQIWITGLFSLGFPSLLLFWGEQYISSGLAGILNGTVPIWTLLFGLISPKTRHFFPLKYLGLLTGLLGVCIIFWPLLHLDGTPDHMLGAASILLMAFSYSIANLLNQRTFCTQPKSAFYANLYYQVWASFIFLMLASLCFESWPSRAVLFHTPLLWIASIYMGLFSTALAWIMYYRLIREWDAVRASAVMYVAPIMAIFWDFILFHHHLRWVEYLGVAAILFGVVLIQWPKSKLKQSSASV